MNLLFLISTSNNIICVMLVISCTSAKSLNKSSILKKRGKGVGGEEEQREDTLFTIDFQSCLTLDVDASRTFADGICNAHCKKAYHKYQFPSLMGACAYI